MLILTIRTDKPEAELGLFEDSEKLAYLPWQAHRELAETIHQKIEELLASERKSLTDVEGIAMFRGPGSFTGLRIGVSVANALADALAVPIVGTSGEGWLDEASRRLATGDNDGTVLPAYGSAPHITPSKK